MPGPGVHACTIGSTHSALRYCEEMICERVSVAQWLQVRCDHVMQTFFNAHRFSAACVQVRLQPAFWRRYMMPGSSPTRAVSSSQQPAGLPASAQLSTVTHTLSGSAAPLQPSAATSQQAPNGLRRAASRKRGRAAAQEEQADTATLAASTETVPAPISIRSLAPAEPVPSLPTNDTTISVEASMSALSEDAVLDPKQAANGNKRRPRSRPQQSKTVAAKGVVPPDQVAVKTEHPSDTGMQPVSASACADNIKDEGLAQARRNPRRTGTAIPSVKAEDPAVAMKQEDQAASLKQEDQATHEDLSSALHVSNKVSDTPALPSADNAQAADPTDKLKPKRKAQKKAAAGVSAADQNGDSINSEPAAAQPAARLSRQKRAKINKVVADTSAAVAQEAAAQDPAVAQAPVAGLDEHKPRKRGRPAKKAAPSPTDAADGDVSSSAADSNVTASEAPAAEDQANPSNVDSTGKTAAPGQSSKPPRKRASRAKKAVAPAAADSEVGASEVVAGSDASMSDASLSIGGSALGAADAAAGADKTSKPRKRAPRAKKAAPPDSPAAPSMSEGLPALQPPQYHK